MKPQLVDSCEAGIAVGGDTTCDGLDGDCDGVADEGFRGRVVDCGEGACANTATTVCVDGEIVGACEPKLPAANDAQCDGVDSDCDGRLDEDFVSGMTTCGRVCAQMGTRTRRWCRPSRLRALPAQSDDNCDGLDQDCDGQTDEDFVPETITCGDGGERTILADCAAGQSVNAFLDSLVPATTVAMALTMTVMKMLTRVSRCSRFHAVLAYVNKTASESVLMACGESRMPLPVPAADQGCDGIDGDCDGIADEHFVGQPTTCGVGACGNTGVVICEDGAPEIVVVLLMHLFQIPNVMGLTMIVITALMRGRSQRQRPVAWACERNGQTLCVAGRWQDECTPGTPADDDGECDGIDEDCDGVIDEGYLGPEETCGQGVCTRFARRMCQNGTSMPTCVPGQPTGSDNNCDAVDDDWMERSTKVMSGGSQSAVSVCA